MENGSTNGHARAKRLAPPSGYDLVQVAAKAFCDPRTVKRYLEGHRTTASTRVRVERALADCGLVDHVRKSA